MQSCCEEVSSFFYCDFLLFQIETISLDIELKLENNVKSEIKIKYIIKIHFNVLFFYLECYFVLEPFLYANLIYRTRV